METLARAANRGSVSTGYEVDNSLKLEADNSEYLKRTPSSASNQRTWTFSAWVKRTELGRAQKIFSARSANTDAGYLGLYFAASDRLDFETYYRHLFITNELYRDTSAWYHIVLALDTTDGTSANRIKLYVNGAQITSFNTYNEAQLGQNYEYVINSTAEHRLGSSYFTSIDFSGYMSEVNFVDGSQLTPTDFGEYDEDSGIWKPKAYTGSHGTNGFYLDFSDSANLGDDVSGNSNNFTETNITAADHSTDTPTNNFCTLNPLWAYAGEATVNNGATTATGVDAAWNGSKATMGVRSGKWYWEVRYSSDAAYTGLQTDGEDNIAASGSLAHVQDTSISFNGNGKYVTEINGSSTSVTGQTALEIGSGAVQGFALDLDSGTKTIKVIRADGVVLTVNLTDSLAELEVFPFVAVYQNYVINYNFGGYTTNTISSAASDANGYGTFEYAPPSGYYALCTKNLAEFG